MTTAEQTGYAFKSGNIARWQRHRSNPIQRTPDGLFRKLDAEFGFTLDAAASHVNAKCDRYFTVDDDGLGRDWGTERVWLNPPFGKGLREWARKAWEASRSGALVVMLVPSATDMDWWHDYILEADEIRFICGEIVGTLWSGSGAEPDYCGCRFPKIIEHFCAECFMEIWTGDPVYVLGTGPDGEVAARCETCQRRGAE